MLCVLAETSLFFEKLSHPAVSRACEHGCLRPWFLLVHETLLGRGYSKFWVPLSASTPHQEYFSLKGKHIIGREDMDYGPCYTVYVFFSGHFCSLFIALKSHILGMCVRRGEIYKMFPKPTGSFGSGRYKEE